MKRLTTSFYLLFALAIGLAVFTAAAQTKIKEVPVHTPDTVEGKALYHEYCAVCHGIDGKGHGPAAEALKAVTTDLTQLAHRNHGQFPAVEVERVINDGGSYLSHGTAAMPVWGSAFSDMNRNPGAGMVRVYALTKYIEQLQAH